MGDSGTVSLNLKFDVQVVHSEFSKALLDDNDICMDSYIVAYKELLKFFQLLGSVFGFVSSDVKNKIEILENLRKGNDGENFQTLKSMVNFERENGLLKKSNYVSGSRTYLRLHRGLDFIKVFLQEVEKLQNEDKVGSVCQTSYDQTLGKFHPWPVRTGARVAMLALPTREGLLKKVCGEIEEVDKVLEVLPNMLLATEEVYIRSQNVYTENNLHSLP